MAAAAAEVVAEKAQQQLPMMGVQEMMERAGDEGLAALPHAFIRPPHDRPLPLSTATTTSHDVSSRDLLYDAEQQQLQLVPIIDISGILSPQSRPQVLHRIAHACAHWGFFQVVNHGVRDEVVQEMRAACWRFFNQPASERNKLRNQKNGVPVSYSTSFNPSMETTLDWKDVLYVRDVPGVCSNGFNLAPEICREAFQQYRIEVQKLAESLFDAIFEGLGLSLASKKETLPPIARLVMGVNFYPRCPDPSSTYGISPHSDVGYVTVLLQDEVPGLQIKKGERWCLVKPVPNAFVINLGDQIEILSNGLYKSIEHRAITNAEKARMSIACFFAPKDSDIIGPLPDFTSDSNPAKYKAGSYGDYIASFYSKALLPNRGSLNFAR